MIHVLDPDRGNVALFKPVSASSIDLAENQPQYLNDGNPKTRWSSAYKENEWCTIDFEGIFQITKVILNWEVAYGKVYDILGSVDGDSWTTLASVTDSDGGIDEVGRSSPRMSDT